MAPVEVPVDIVWEPEYAPVWSPLGGEGCPASIDLDNSSIMGTEAEVCLLGKCAKWSLSSLGGEWLPILAVPSTLSPKVCLSLPHASDEAEVVSDDANSGWSSDVTDESCMSL